MATSLTHCIEGTGQRATTDDRDTFGGAAHLPAGVEHPRCKLCDSPMCLFLQFDIRPEFGLGLAPGSHLLAFMCPEHNDAPILADPYSEHPLPAGYWEQDLGHYAVLVARPGATARPKSLDAHIAPQTLKFTSLNEEIATSDGISSGSQDFKVGGVPYWINFAVEPACACGGRLRFVCQIPENFGFAKTPTAPTQPNSFSRTEYCYLLGNFVYLLACDRQCDPRAAIAVCDN